MKKILILALALVLSSCVGCGKEDEDFGPYPDEKYSRETPR